MIGAEFLGMIMLIVYVGAVAFLFFSLSFFVILIFSLLLFSLLLFSLLLP
jgi:hypothetical protein